MVAVGLGFGRRFIAPIFILQRGTQAVAGGDLESRVHIGGSNEFADLGHAFNTMADRLVELQENVKRQERQAMFGRIAAGLFHDLSHPIQNLGNSARLLAREDIDAESRDTFQRTIEREVASLKRFMDDLRNIAKPKPIERFAMDVNVNVSEIVDSMRPEGERNGIVVEARYAEGPLTIDGDRFALARVYRNLIMNAIQATRAGRTGRDRDGARRRPRAGHRRRHRFGHRRGSPRRRSSTTSSPPSGAGSASGSPSRSALSSSSTARSPSKASSGAERPSHCGSRLATWNRRRRPASGLSALDFRLWQEPKAGAKTSAEEQMFRTLVKTELVAVDGHSYRVRYFELKTGRGARRFSAEILLGPADRIILDGDSLTNLEARTARLAPATVYSRTLARVTAA